MENMGTAQLMMCGFRGDFFGCFGGCFEGVWGCFWGCFRGVLGIGREGGSRPTNLGSKIWHFIKPPIFQGFLCLFQPTALFLKR